MSITRPSTYSITSYLETLEMNDPVFDRIYRQLTSMPTITATMGATLADNYIVRPPYLVVGLDYDWYRKVDHAPRLPYQWDFQA